MTLTVYSVNVNGLTDEDKRLAFFQWLFHSSHMVVCLQETHAVSSSELSSWVSRFGYLCAGSFGSNCSCGVAFLYHSVPVCRDVLCEFDSQFVLAEFDFCDSVFRVACVYALNSNLDCVRFLIISICLSLLSFAISILFSPVLWTVVAPPLSTLLVKALLCCILSSSIVVLLMFGV